VQADLEFSPESESDGIVRRTVDYQSLILNSPFYISDILLRLEARPWGAAPRPALAAWQGVGL
jgi:hypothetical protein